MPPSDAPPPGARRASLFRNGRNQALRIPKVFELPGEEVMVHRDGRRLIVEPIAQQSGLLALLATLPAIDEDFPCLDEGTLPLDDVPMAEQ